MEVASSLWQTVDAVVVAEGAELFDVDAPGGHSGGVLRVYITTEQDGGVTFEDCVRVSKRLLDLDEQQEFIPQGCSLEVSSPGVNRRLRLESHFAGAVGERVRVKYKDVETEKFKVVFGVIQLFQEGIVTLDSEEDSKAIVIPFSNIKEARVDFKF